ncbi:hypothetical protein L218DRAFT_27861 [Marasmius fiardii PR-910]|nr:hypothetical protein L218DRAFT_27861 [Marasmius fiardii PR-910]
MSGNGFFTMIIGRLFRVEVLTLMKIGAVLMSFGGTVLVALSDNNKDTKFTDPTALMKSVAERPRPLLLGDALALTSALFYAIYTITLKVGIKSESRIDMKLFFGFVGIFNTISLWPIAILLHVTGLEKFELPSNGKETSPLVVTVGLSLTMPLAVIGDFFLGKPVAFQVIAGALLVLAGVVLVGIEDGRILKKLEKEEEERAIIANNPTEDVELDLSVDHH